LIRKYKLTHPVNIDCNSIWQIFYMFIKNSASWTFLPLKLRYCNFQRIVECVDVCGVSPNILHISIHVVLIFTIVQFWKFRTNLYNYEPSLVKTKVYQVII
jgi:hypothetical protein